MPELTLNLFGGTGLFSSDQGPWRDVSYQACLEDGTVINGVVRVPRHFFVSSKIQLSKLPRHSMF